MRESRNFGERSITLNSDNPNIKYILISEGTKTEPCYFNAISQNKDALGISSLVQIVQLERSYGEKTWSNPKKILDRVLLNLNESETGITYTTLLNGMVDCLYYSEYLTKRGQIIKDFTQVLNDFYVNVLNKKPEDVVEDKEKTIKLATDYLKNNWPRICNLIIKNLSETLQEQQILYDSDIDKVCLIVDRDPQSFTVNQFDEVMQTCNENKIQFYISNPCFEFWLMLHFDQIFELDTEKMLANQPISNSNSAKSYLENELRKNLGSYKKKNFDVNCLMQNIDKAITNEKKFCEDCEGLKKYLGSNVGLLITEMRNQA